MGENKINIITIKNLNVYFNEMQVLNNICCAIPKNKITVIIGQSGCGKSTLLKSINRIVEEENGRITGKIEVNCQDIMNIDKNTLRKKIGLVFQTPVIFPYSIKKNMLYPLKYHYRLDEQAQHERVIHYLEMTGLYGEIKSNLNLQATKLSGGQKQRLSIARCLCIEPEILMLDEPCSSLDIKNTLSIENMLLELKQDFTIIMVTHNLSQAKRLADYILFMDGGEVIEAGDNSIFANSQNELTREYIKYMND